MHEVNIQRRHKTNSKIIVTYIEERTVGTVRGESPKQGIISAKDL